MREHSLCIGDWVDFYCLDGDKPLTGFIVDMSASAKVFHVFVPAGTSGTAGADGIKRELVTGKSSWASLTSKTAGSSETARVSANRTPRGNRTYTVRFCDAEPSPTRLYLSDIPALTDISLDTRDEKWFYHLVNYVPKTPVNANTRFLLFFVPLLSLFVVLV
ncbi:hypothetical protein [Alicyclobacillus sp. SO9]|uniref:hypothetical protein n=1 Tax=Alicyclobacillus sp. SO9 TaxID=2665646 RepID=UPI0018E8F04B|nr:hypothetical protein [Alicyclobacillus sp. SO9]QQE79276.1 hypothetical protein GI364_01835 [Alicyclobacillus sp. SO9]